MTDSDKPTTNDLLAGIVQNLFAIAVWLEALATRQGAGVGGNDPTLAAVQPHECHDLLDAGKDKETP